jgi:hypothetical protein
MSNFRFFFVVLFLLYVHVDVYGYEQSASNLKTIIAEKFTVDIPVSWDFQLEERKGQFGAVPPNQKGMYPSPWLMIEFCVFDPNASISGTKSCEVTCPSEDKVDAISYKRMENGKETPMVKLKQGDEIRYFRREIDSSAGGLQMTSCSPKGIATASIIFVNEEKIEFLETILRSFRWK